MKIDFLKKFSTKNGVGYEVASLYTTKSGDDWVITGRWYGSHPPVLGAPVRYLRGEYGFMAVEG